MFILPLSGDTAVDLVVTSLDLSIAQQRGLRFRAVNDLIRMQILPSSSTHIAVPAMEIRLGKFFVDLNRTADIEVVTTLLQDQDGRTALIAVPRISSGYERTINIRFDKRSGAGETTVLEFDDVLGVFIDDVPVNVAEIINQSLTIHPGHTLGFAVRGRARIYQLVLWSTNEQPVKFALRRAFESAAVQLISSPGGPTAYQFALGLIPSLGERLLLGKATASLAESSFAYLIYPPLGPGNMHWITCALQPGSIPLSYSHKIANRFPIPYLGFATSDGEWALGAHHPQGSWHELVVCLIGRPDVSHIRSLVESQIYRRIYVITDNSQPASYFDSLKASITQAASDKFVFAQVGNTRLAVATTDWTADDLEEITINVATLELMEAPYDDYYRQFWRSVIDDRLPRIPVVPDPRVGSMCVLINLVRGRVPDGTAQALENWSGIFAENVWLVPWENSNLGIEQLAVELIARASSEYIVIQGIAGMGREHAEANPEGLISAELQQQLTELFHAYLQASGQEVASCRVRLRDSINRSGIGRRQAMSIFAEHICRIDPSERYAAGMAFTNPFVVVLIEDETPWELVALNLAYQTAYAGCSSRAKMGAIVPRFIRAAELEQLKEGLRSLRVAFHDLDDPKRITRIRECRRTIGNQLARTVGSMVQQALERVGADRIVAFSDFGLDFLPFGDGVLGMEIPLTRLPASWSAMFTVGIAVQSATTGQSVVRGGPLTTGSRAAIIAADLPTDEQTRWCRELADVVKERLKWVGLIAEPLSIGNRPVPDLLASCAKDAVVMFFGHASASDGAAGLNLGNGNFVTVQDIMEFDWSGKLVILVGCETAAQDSEEVDIAAAFLQRGARAVIGTAAKVSVSIADFLFGQLLELLIEGMPIDYAFFLARRRAAAFETLRAIMSTRAAIDRIATAVNRGAERNTLRTFLDEVGVQWADMELDSVYAPTFSLLGGSGQTLV